MRNRTHSAGSTGALILCVLCIVCLTGLEGCGRAMTQTAGPEVYSAEAGTYWFSGLTAEEILAELSLEEKIWQMTQPAVQKTDPEKMQAYDFGSLLSQSDDTYLNAQEWAALIDEYQMAALQSDTGLPFVYGQDHIHGVNYCKGAVVFPHNIGLGAASDPELMYQIGAATAEEAKMTKMIWNFAPCVAVNTDPRWGRTFENYSSDPEIVKNLSTSYTRGMLDHGLIACAKHYLADGSETWGTGEGSFLIDRGDAQLSREETSDLLDIYQSLIDAGIQTVMLSHGSINGVKMHENTEYISILRNELGFDGVIISDWESIHNIGGESFKEQLVRAVNAGVDMLMEPYVYEQAHDLVLEAVVEGSISENRIDEAVLRILRMKIESGIMDNPMLEYPDSEIQNVGSEQYRELAERAVEESMVLLKNDGNILPVRSGMSVYVTGPAADDSWVQCGGWTESWQGPVRPLEGAVTILEGLKAAAQNLEIRVITDPEQAAEADLILLFAGEKPYAEWYGDSEDISLTGKTGLEGNTEAIRQVQQLRQEYHIPVAACIVAGRHVIITEYLDQWDAVVMCYLPGTEGKGVADVITGSAAFSGTLPMPWYSSVSEIGTDACLFPRGWGLSTEQIQ